MSIEHVTITDPQIHEPKGISTAGVNTQYIATGSGSGTWRKTKSTDLQGLSGDGGVANKTVVSDGANGFKFITGYSYGSMTITNNSVVTAMTAVADTTFNTASQFSLMTGSGSPWAGEILEAITFTTDKLTVSETGIYLLTSYISISSFPSATARIALRYRINGSTYSTRKPTIKSSGTGAEGQIIGNGLLSLTAGDYVQLYIASDATGNLTIRDASFILHKVN